MQELSEATEVRAAETAEAKAHLEKQIEDMERIHDEEKVWVHVFKLHVMFITIKEKINIL